MSGRTRAGPPYEKQEKRYEIKKYTGAKEAILESPYVVQEPENCRNNWENVFPGKKSLHIEVGMGKGRFLMDMARLHPDVNYIGIEMYDSVLLRAVQKREEMHEEGDDLPNLLFMRMTQESFLWYSAKARCRQIYLNFSDPWPKARHAKRRLTSREFLARYEQILEKEGTVNSRQTTGNFLNFPWRK